MNVILLSFERTTGSVRKTTMPVPLSPKWRTQMSSVEKRLPAVDMSWGPGLNGLRVASISPDNEGTAFRTDYHVNEHDDRGAVELTFEV